MSTPYRAPDPVTASIALGAAVGVFAVSFGVLATATGLSVIKACALSLLVFTGASQFTAVGVLHSGGTPATAVGSALLLAARNGAYGLTLSRRFQRSLPVRLVAAHLTIDESTAMATAQPDAERAEKAFWTTGLAVFVFWNLGTLIGALIGDHIGDPKRYGLDAAFPTGFVALLLPQLRLRPARVAALIGATVAVVLVPLTPVGVPILAATVGAAVGCLRWSGQP